MRFSPQWVKGKKILRVSLNPFRDGRGGKAHAPVIHFTDGSQIYFVVEETEHESGVDIVYVPAPRKPK